MDDHLDRKIRKNCFIEMSETTETVIKSQTDESIQLTDRSSAPRVIRVGTRKSEVLEMNNYIYLALMLKALGLKKKFPQNCSIMSSVPGNS